MASSSSSSPGIMHLYKNQLQIYVQKKSLNLPMYISECEGPQHALCFRCKVTVDEETFESTKLYKTKKDAENAAAQFALISLQQTEVKEVMYKNLLQDVAQKEGLELPLYITSKSGEAHNPSFTSR